MSAPDKPSILIVDDDTVLRHQLARAFTTRGFDVRSAGGFDEAITEARLDPPEYAVVDQRIPGHSGLELIEELLGLDPETKIVVLTGYGSIATAIDAVRLGATYYLAKPADADEILQAFERGSAAPQSSPKPQSSPNGVYEAPSLARAEWEHIHRVLADCGGNISLAARRLKIHRRSLQRKLNKYAPP